MFKKRKQEEAQWRIDVATALSNLEHMLDELADKLGYEWDIKKTRGNTPVEWGWFKVKKGKK